MPYDIHFHIKDICKEFKNVIAAITKISNEFLSVTFIYRYCYNGCDESDSTWRWIVGRDSIGTLSLKDLIKAKSIFHQIIDGNTYYIFGNSKKDLANKGIYHLSNRDEMYNDIGSVFSIKVAFGDNFSSFVEGIITVTSYGKSFTEYLDIDDAPAALQKMIIDEIIKK